MSERNPFFDDTIANVYDIAEAPSYMRRLAAEKQSTAAAEQAERDQDAQREQAAKRVTTRRRMAERGLTLISGGKRS